MNSPTAKTKDPVPSEHLAEAGVWIARLHGDERGAALEAGFRQWLHANTLNARAFELATEVWEEAENLRRIVPFSPTAPAKPNRLRPFALAAGLGAILLLSLSVTFYFHSDGVATAVGEQRMLTLEDGTRVYLNTATRVVVHYEKSARRVELKTGEALFEVAKRPNWPFIVSAGGEQVRALGTTFVVRRDDQQLAITLVEGKVTVSPVVHATVSRIQPSADVETLAPGQRLTLAMGKAAQVDTPSLDKAIAWRRGQVVLDDTSLANAVAEMNRYNAVKLIIERPEAREIIVNGLFQAGDSASFANAVAQTYGLHVVEHRTDIVLSGIPHPVPHQSP